MVQSIDDQRASRRSAARIPPHNLEAEESLLGSMLLSRDAITAAVEARVDASDFYKPAYGHIFEAVWSLYEQGEPVDPVTVAEELRRAGLLEALGGKGTLTQIQASTPASANAGHYAKIVSELALLRRLITVSGEIAESAYNQPDDVTETVDRAEAMVFEVAEKRISESLVRVFEAVTATVDQLEALYGDERHDDRGPDRLHRARQHPARASSPPTSSSPRPVPAWARRASPSVPQRTSRWSAAGRSVLLDGDGRGRAHQAHARRRKRASTRASSRPVT